ncbi:two-component system sensor protein [Cellvibrio japonicus Ueda107]|uniref:Two-component system sensor protein n=2 Tax=Cellvibrio japonicus TaxID=155077 RepID=B3PBB6_CELJU|nr:two-component system sensor protein [Cellvibrio japonicus Ueda107]
MNDKSSYQYCSSSPYSDKSWIWLIFSLYYFVPLYYMSFNLIGYALLVGAYFIFIGLFLWASTLGRHQVWMPILAIILLALAITPHTPGSSTFFTYVGFLIGYCYSTRIYLGILALVIALILALQLHFDYPVPFFSFPAISGVITISAWGYIERLRFDARVRWIQSRQEIEQLAIIAERERIARDLHDILGHTLSSIALKAELAEKLLKQSKQEQAEQHLSELHQIARNSLSLVRQTVSGYKHRGLSGEVMELCDKLRQNGFVVELAGEIPQLSPRAETAVILALTELTTNILRHSKGNHCQIEFSRNHDQLLVCMRDNGAVEKLVPGNGLTGIKERLQALAGDLHASVHRGCEFLISLPAHELQQQ